MDRIVDELEESGDEYVVPDDLTGRKYFDLTVLERIGKKKYLVQCKCGLIMEKTTFYIGRVDACRKCSYIKHKRGF